MTIETFSYHEKGDFYKMTNDQLFHELSGWSSAVKEASGWSSTYFAAKCLEHVVKALNRRGVTVKNPHSIKRG